MERRGFGVLVCILAAGLIAVAATGDSKDRFTARQRNYWAFQSVHRPEQPQVKRQPWVRNPIDAFILAKLEAKDLDPSPEADKITLLRRVSFDLIGLPPSDTEVSAFVADRSSDAYERVVDRLLASPHFGEP